MRAYVLTTTGCELAEVPDPTPGPGEVVVRTTAAGLCHSDLTLAARRPEAHPFSLPMVLGHELAGTVVEIPSGVAGLRVGDPVVGYGPRGCGRCDSCSRGAENYCRAAAGSFAPGLGSDGALAEYVAVDAAHLVPSADVPPAQGAALTDAGLTALHALNRALGTGPPLRSRAATVVVLGVGGVGHAAVQLARLAGATVVAVDRSASKLALAAALGAEHTFLAGGTTVADVQEVTGGRGVDVVLDLVASDDTLRQAGAMLAVNGVLSIVGVGSGRLPVGMHALPLGARTDLPFWGTRPELDQLLELARSGQVHLQVEEFSLERTAEAYALLDRGEVRGRAVVLPDLDH